VRKSPIRHTVHRHKRGNAPIVRSYTRGKGRAPKVPRKPFAPGPHAGLSPAHVDSVKYQVSIDYVGGKSFAASVSTESSKTALSKGLDMAPSGTPGTIVLKRVEVR